jgi:hypothetical protein
VSHRRLPLHCHQHHCERTPLPSSSTSFLPPGLFSSALIMQFHFCILLFKWIIIHLNSTICIYYWACTREEAHACLLFLQSGHWLVRSAGSSLATWAELDPVPKKFPKIFLNLFMIFSYIFYCILIDIGLYFYTVKIQIRY